MNDDNSQRDIQKNYSEVVNNNPIIKYYVKGISRFLILWIIKYNKVIHGYGILKELDKFFEIFIDELALKKSNPSNIYPILNKMEESGVITSEIDVKNNKKLKYFRITEDGEYVLKYVWSRFDIIHASEQWKLLFDDMNEQ